MQAQMAQPTADNQPTQPGDQPRTIAAPLQRLRTPAVTALAGANIERENRGKAILLPTAPSLLPAHHPLARRTRNCCAYRAACCAGAASGGDPASIQRHISG
jgi:hypothetical protein